MAKKAASFCDAKCSQGVSTSPSFSPSLSHAGGLVTKALGSPVDSSLVALCTPEDWSSLEASYSKWHMQRTAFNEQVEQLAREMAAEIIGCMPKRGEPLKDLTTLRQEWQSAVHINGGLKELQDAWETGFRSFKKARESQATGEGLRSIAGTT
eukprot:5568858-Prymnesium_polylepis.1